MLDDKRMDRFEDKLDQISRSVCIIEKEHGAKLGALFDAQQVANERLDRVDGRLDRIEGDVGVIKIDVAVLKTDVGALKTDVRDIKRGMGVLQSIASDHEDRIQETENTLEDHVAGKK